MTTWESSKMPSLLSDPEYSEDFEAVKQIIWAVLQVIQRGICWRALIDLLTTQWADSYPALC